MWSDLGLTHRMATLDDVDIVLGLVHAAETADLGGPFTSRADTDVHPSARGRGVGRAVVEWTERRAVERAEPAAEVRIGQTVIEDLAGAQELFVERGYERLWDSWVLRMPADAPLAPLRPPTGVSIRPFRPEEEHEIYEVIDAAFSEWEGREARSFQDWQAIVTRRPDFDPGLLLVAVSDGQVIGAAAAIDYGFEGWLDQIAVRPEHRGQGIAKALLLAVFADLRGRGRGTLGLNTDSRTGALGLYTGIGMTVDETYVRWSRVMRPASAE